MENYKYTVVSLDDKGNIDMTYRTLDSLASARRYIIDNCCTDYCDYYVDWTGSKGEARFKWNGRQFKKQELK